MSNLKNGKSIYIVLTDSGNIKIGVSKDVATRINAIKNQTGCVIKKVFASEKCSNSLLIEKILHKKYENYRIFGEWFSVNFEEAVKDLKIIFSEIAEFREKEKNEIDLVLYFHPDLARRHNE